MDQPHGTDYRQFSSRLQTFRSRSASISQVSSVLLAINGFIFCEDGVNNRILCPFCFQSYNDGMEMMEQLAYTHGEHCPFLNQSQNQSQHNYSSIFNSRINVDNPEHFIFDPNTTQRLSEVNVIRLETDIAIQSLRSQRQEQESSRHSSEMRNIVSNVVTVPSTLATVPSTIATVPSTLATVPSAVATVPLNLATVPSTLVIFPSILATVPSTLATVPSTLETLPSTLATVQNVTERDAVVPIYAELGIIMERPLSFKYAMFDERKKSFSSWPRDHPLKPEKLAEAGFYYAGYGDCARCFYCGGGLRNWEDEDDVWVEHARWFPKCGYIRQKMGRYFVDKVQEINKTKLYISFKDVEESMEQPFLHSHEDSEDFWKRQPSVKAVVEMGYPINTVIAAAKDIRKEGNIVSADLIVERLSAKEKKKSDDPAYDLKQFRSLKEQNHQLRHQTVCKICMDKEVAVVFLPCGHFVSCVDCASALIDCPVCRNCIKGNVQAFLG